MLIRGSFAPGRSCISSSQGRQGCVVTARGGGVRSARAWGTSSTPSLLSSSARYKLPAKLFGLPRRDGPAMQLPGRRTVAVNNSAGGLVPLGFDLMAFLGSTVVIIPVFRKFNISPVLGFLAAGVILKQTGIERDLEDLSKLSELGVLFLLFEMGLELSLDRLKTLAKYAFGIGSLQMLLCIAIFTGMALPVGQGIGTSLLHDLSNAPMPLVSIRSVDEAIVIGAALSLSSSAFVLQLLSERGEMTSRFGSATLGVLLFQDIAVVPFLVLLPLLESGMLDGNASPVSLMQELGPTAALTLAGLGVALISGRVVLRRIFEVVADSRNSETFVATCLLTVAGASMLTAKLGFSDTLGAFIAGILLSETNYKTQVEADIKPFRGLLLGLFFVTTGSSIDLDILSKNWELVAWILAGLLSIKTGVIATLGRGFGLTGNEALRLGFTLSQGGEFAFVLLSLANSLKILPEDLNQILIIVVVLSMAMTPLLAEGGKMIADKLDDMAAANTPANATVDETEWRNLPPPAAEHDTEDSVVICGFGLQAQMLANMLESPLAGSSQRPYVAFDLDPKRVQVARSAGFSVVYGDGSRQAVLKAAGVKKPKAIVVCLGERQMAVTAVHTLRQTYPKVKIYACGKDLQHAAELEEAGADNVVLGPTMAGMALGAAVLKNQGVSNDDISFLRSGITDALVAQTHSLAAELQNNSGAIAPVELLMLDRERHSNNINNFLANLGDSAFRKPYLTGSESDEEYGRGSFWDAEIDTPSSVPMAAQAAMTMDDQDGEKETYAAIVHAEVVEDEEKKVKKKNEDSKATPVSKEYAEDTAQSIRRD